eukprot:963999_1
MKNKQINLLIMRETMHLIQLIGMFVNVHLWQAMERTDLNEIKKKKYQYHHRLLLLCIIPIVSFIAWIIPSKTTAIIMYSVMILLGITVLVVAKHKSRNNTSGSFLTQINGIFDIPNTEDGVYDASRKHHGLVLVLSVVIYSLHLLIANVFYNDILWYATWFGNFAPAFWAAWLCINCYFVIDPEYMS